MQNTEILEIDKQISAVFKSPAAAEKYNQLIAQRSELLKKQTSDERKTLERDIAEVKQRQETVGERRYQLVQTIKEKAEAVRQIRAELDRAEQEFAKANLDLSFFEQQVSEDRILLNYSLKRLNALIEKKIDDETIN